MPDRHTELRLERKRQLLGTSTPVCKSCRVRDVRVLQRGNKALEMLCRCCYRKQTQLTPEILAQTRTRLGEMGFGNACCAICAEAAVETIELHHIASEANSIELAPLCLNCHAMVSDAQEDLVPDLRRRDSERGPLLRQAAYEMGIAVLIGAFLVLSKSINETQRLVLTSIATVFMNWASWNVAADADLSNRFGPGYITALEASVPK